jgi:glycosyltransferase involved in cell wall biosynthesis
MNEVSLTTVVPVYAGKDYLLELVERLAKVRDEWRDSDCPISLREAIFVNDGSSDGSFEVLCDIEKVHAWVKVVNLSRNYGQHQATIAGILHSSGDWVVSLDEDLQHDPLLIEKLLSAAIECKNDVVYANAEEEVHQNFVRDVGSRSFKRLVSLFTGNKHVPKFNSFRLIRGSIARAAAAVCSHGTYFDIALCWFTDRISSIKLPLTDARFVETGKSSYTLRRLFSHARLLIMSSEAKVARIGAGIGLMAVTLSVLLGTKVFVEKLLSPDSVTVEGWTSLILTLLFSTGLLAILLSIVLEYISLIVLHIQGKPTFFVVNRDRDELLIDYFKNK